MTAAEAPRKTDLRQIFSFISVGLIAGAIALPLTISFGALIYSGDLSEFAPIGIGMMLFGAFAPHDEHLTVSPNAIIFGERGPSRSAGFDCDVDCGFGRCGSRS